MRNYQDALRLAREEAQKRYPEHEYTVKSLIWTDGDFRVQVRHGFSRTEEENSLAEQVVVTPHQAKVQLVETTQSEEYNVHNEEEL